MKRSRTQYWISLAFLSVCSIQGLLFLWRNPTNYSLGGYCSQSFGSVREVFRSNFADSLEREGASVAVYHKGRREVYLWGGYADSQSGRKWTQNTRTLLFSATKAISSLCVALLVDRGSLSYEDLVSQHWPEYGQYGKNATTIEDVLTHKAGIPYLDERIEIEDVGTERVRQKIERTRPAWPPGTASGYHAVTFGFILDEIFKKVDGRDIATFFKEEVTSKYNLDATIGVPPEEFQRSARVTLAPTMDYVRDIIRDPRLIFMLGFIHIRFDGIIEKILATNSWIHFGLDMLSLNDPWIQSLPLPAVTGSATADAIASLFSLLLQGELVSNQTLSLLHAPTLDSWHFERVVVYPVRKGHGFFYEPHPTIKGAYTFGHPGYGGQIIHVDPSLDLVLVYISNGLKTGSGELCVPSQKLLKSVYRIIAE